MEENPDHQHRNNKQPFPQKRMWKVCGNYLRNHNSKAYVIFLILTYAFGYFTAYHSLSKQYNPTIVAKTTAHNCPPGPQSLSLPLPPPTTTLQSPILSILNKSNDHNLFGEACAKPVEPDQVRPTLLKELYDGASPYENFPPAHIARLLEPKSIIGWGSNGEVFENLIKKVRPKTIIEIGAFLGASATHMATLTRNLGLDTQILCVDDFRGWPGFRKEVGFFAMENGNVMLMAQFLQNVMSLNSSDVILPIPFSCNTALAKLCEWGVMGNLIEVDAGHDFHSVWMDVNLAHKLLKPGGVMFGHDYFNGVDNFGVRRAVDLFAKIHGYRVNVDGQHWVLE